MIRSSPLIACALLLCACGSYTLPPESPPLGGGGGGGGPTATKNCDELFALIEPRLEFCRNCHVPGGVADVPDGKRMMLSSDRAQDRQNLRDSWERLGRNDSGKSRILKMASGTDTRSHTGGSPWPVGSDAYREMDGYLLGLVDASACVLSGLGSGNTSYESMPLLGSARGGHLWDTFCEGKPDDTPMPVDPRSLVQPGIDAGKAVQFNAYWQDCGRNQAPKSCGELRANIARGESLIAGNGAVGAGHEFGGDAPQSQFSYKAADYNNLWQKWGLEARPQDFDQIVEERYGLALSARRNPYPLPGEDPNATDGGSGQLPAALTQLRDADGAYNGNIGVTCSVCHSGKVGSPADGPGLGPIYGTNSLHDLRVFFTEMGGDLSSFGILSLDRVRGTGNITNFQLFMILESTDPTTMTHVDPRFFIAPSTATEDAPVWWNLGHRPLKFFEGGLPTDATRIELSWYYPNAGIVQTDAARSWILEHEEASTNWIAHLKAPAWPASVLGAIDEALAKQGAILFHSKNLWEPSLDNPSPRPAGGNGSCASCHGAYSPRFVHDPSFLAQPELEGVGGYVTPIGIIGTDSRRLDGDDEGVYRSARNSWFAYRDAPQCGDQNDPRLRGDRELGYLAPPLYGVWATAPYFHNGAVPTVWEVLKPADRHGIWRRVSKPAVMGGGILGFDTDLRRAYDVQNLGWKYDALQCGDGTTPYLDCNPGDEYSDPIVQLALNGAYANGGVLWNVTDPPILNDSQIEQRKVYNTHLYSQSNAGHAFTSVLTDQERRALIEYLKTL